MRRKRTKPEPIAPDMLAWLKDEGEAPIEHFFLFEEDLKALWDSQKAAIIAEWIIDYPGTRPSMFWRFDAHDKRRNESQRRYLKRHKLLLPGEQS